MPWPPLSGGSPLAEIEFRSATRAAMSALVPVARIYADRAPRGTALPFIVATWNVSMSAAMRGDGSATMSRRGQIQIDLYETAKVEAGSTLADDLYDTLDGAKHDDRRLLVGSVARQADPEDSAVVRHIFTVDWALTS